MWKLMGCIISFRGIFDGSLKKLRSCDEFKDLL